VVAYRQHPAKLRRGARPCAPTRHDQPNATTSPYPSPIHRAFTLSRRRLEPTAYNRWHSPVNCVGRTAVRPYSTRSTERNNLANTPARFIGLSLYRAVGLSRRAYLTAFIRRRHAGIDPNCTVASDRRHRKIASGRLYRLKNRRLPSSNPLRGFPTYQPSWRGITLSCPPRQWILFYRLNLRFENRFQEFFDLELSYLNPMNIIKYIAIIAPGKRIQDASFRLTELEISNNPKQPKK